MSTRKPVPRTKRAIARVPAMLEAIGQRLPEALELFDYLEDVQFWVKDTAGRFLWVNVPFLLDYGLKERGEVIGRTDFDLSDWALADQYRRDDEKVLKGSKIPARIELVGRFNHTARWCVTSKVPLHDTRGRIVGTAGLNHPLRDELSPRSESPLSGAIAYINQHFQENIPNEKLAKASGMSVRAFHRRFVAQYHVSPHTYVRQLRVRMACQPLVFSGKSLAAIAGEFGFADQSHFTKEFRHFMGETPRKYRARHRPEE